MNNNPNPADSPVTHNEGRPGRAWAGAEALVPKLATALVAIAALLAAVMQPAPANQPDPVRVTPVSTASSR